MKKIIGSFMLGTFLFTSAAILNAQDKHQWNEGENAAWHQYLKEHHKKDHDWAKAKKKEQQDYWKWRDQHRDVH
jgi:hypothetical protein